MNILRTDSLTFDPEHGQIHQPIIGGVMFRPCLPLRDCSLPVALAAGEGGPLWVHTGVVVVACPGVFFHPASGLEKSPLATRAGSCPAIEQVRTAGQRIESRIRFGSVGEEDWIWLWAMRRQIRFLDDPAIVSHPGDASQQV